MNNGNRSSQNRGQRPSPNGTDSYGYNPQRNQGYNRNNSKRYSQNPANGRRPNPNAGYQSPPGYTQPRRHPMPEREYRAWQEKQRITAAERRHRAEVEKLMRKQQKRRRRQHSRQIFLGRLAVFGVVLAILTVISGGVFLILFNSTPDAVEEHRISYTYEGTVVRKVDFDTAFYSGQYYFCFDDLADYLHMAQTGSMEERRFLFTGLDVSQTVGTVDPNHTASDQTTEPTGDSRGDGTEEWVRFPTEEAAAIVNGQRVPLDAPNRLIEGEVWVPVDFVTDVMANLSLQIDGDTIAISKMADTSAETTGDEKNSVILYLSPTFRQKSTAPIDQIPEEEITLPPGLTEEDGEIDLELANVTFINDLTAYEQYMAPENRDSYLTLVNPTNTLSADYAPTDLMDVAATAKGKTTQKLRQIALKALEALLLEMTSEGFTDMQVNSGFRTYDYQAMLFKVYTENELAAEPGITLEEAERRVLTYSTRPGTSEHQTGLAVDMATDASFSTDFANSKEYAWLEENAWKFGFILRFPADKVHVTGIQFEPWHWRFVGRYHAKKIHDAGVCLEEYLTVKEAEETAQTQTSGTAN